MSPKILKKKKKSVRKSSFPFLVFAPFLASIFLGLFQLVLANALSVQGVRFKELESEKEIFLQKQKELQVQKAELVALWQVEKKASEELSMHKALESVLYISPHRLASLSVMEHY